MFLPTGTVYIKYYVQFNYILVISIGLQVQAIVCIMNQRVSATCNDLNLELCR